MKWTTEAKVGLFSLIGLIAFAIVVIHLSQIVLFGKSGFQVTGYFPEAEGITPGNSVRYAGVDVGRVDQVGVTEGKAQIIIRFYDGEKIPSDARFNVQSSGVIGDHYIRVSEGNPRSGYLSGGMTIYGTSEGGMEQTMQKVDRVVDAAQKMVDGVNTVVTDKASQESIKSTIQNVNEVTRNLTVLTSRGMEAAGHIDAAAAQMNAFMQQMNGDGKVTADVRTVMDNMVTASENAKVMSAEAQTVSRRINGIMEGQGLSGQAELLYNTTKGKFSPNLFLRMGDRRYGLFGAESVGNHTVGDAQFGQNQGDWDFRTGIMRNKFGIGADYTSGLWKFGTDIYDPDRLTFRIRGNYRINSDLYAVAQTILPHSRTGGGEYIGIGYTY
ncbi:MAG TPA: MCE family protein [Veillonellaceae bacterium]|nr:MCE family protein [Veillonellaceae bacterium]